jgi:putative mRNA 3-end processing factor
VIPISNPITIKFLGGTREVGRSAISVKGGNTQVLLDYGVMMEREPGFPIHVPPNEVNGIILTHSHLDHSGAVPIFHIRTHIPVFTTIMTAEVSRLLITDFIHLSGYYLPFEFLDLQNMMNSCVYMDYRQTREIGDLRFSLLEAGHIPGSSQCIIEYDGKRVLYTGDFNTLPTHLLRGADTDYGKLDALIMEATYANEDHPDRENVDQKFMARVNEVVERGGTVLVPAFSVGRSQEILCLLAAHHFEHSVTVDGMAEDANEIIMRYPSYLRDSRLFMDAMHSAHWIKGWRDRRAAVKKPGIIVSPAGMLMGGNAIFYMNTIARRQENAVFLVSYQVPESPGRRLLETSKFNLGGKIRQVSAEVEQFVFSSHCGRKQLLETAARAGKNARIFIMHGAEGNCERLVDEIHKEVGAEALAPKAGDTFEI